MFFHRNNLIFFIFVWKFYSDTIKICSIMRCLDFQLWYFEDIFVSQWLCFLITFYDFLEYLLEAAFIFGHQKKHLTVFFEKIYPQEKVIFVSILQNKYLVSLILVHGLKAGNFYPAKVHNFPRNVIKRVSQLNLLIKGSIEDGLVHPNFSIWFLDLELRKVLFQLFIHQNNSLSPCPCLIINRLINVF